MRNRNNQIQSPPLTRGGLGWGKTIFDTLIIPFKTSSNPPYRLTNKLLPSSLAGRGWGWGDMIVSKNSLFSNLEYKSAVILCL